MMIKTALIMAAGAAIMGNAFGQNMSWFHSAQLCPKGTACIIPSACYYNDRGAFRPAWGAAYGMQFVYGMSDKMNLAVRSASYSHVFPDDRINFGYLGVTPKIGLVPERAALSFPIGFNISEYFNVQADAKLHLSWIFPGGAAITLSPALDLMLGIASGAAFGSDISLGIPLGRKSAQLVFEAGTYMWPFNEWANYSFAGAGLRLAFGRYE